MRITTFQWLLIDRSLLVDVWQPKILCSPNCVACPNEIDQSNTLCGTAQRRIEYGGGLIKFGARHIQVGECMLFIRVVPIDRYHHQEEGMVLVIKAQEMSLSVPKH